MGRDWLYWVTGGGSGGGGGSASRRRKMSSGKMKEAAAAAASAGCGMCAVFQLFDLHHFQQPSNIDTSLLLHEEAISSKGVEAPRNSLELEEEPPFSMSSATKKEDENLNFPVGIQIKTSSRSHQTRKISTSSSPRVSTCASTPRTTTTTIDDFGLKYSPGTKTPSLVARLMGLDLLPECTSPSLNSSSSPNPKPNQKRDRNYLRTRSSRRSTSSCIEDDTSINGARSLPETPRVSSSSSARRSDFEYHHHRLSLQNEDTSSSRQGSRFRQQQQQQLHYHENRMMISSSSCSSSPGHHAKQIVKQVKESVSRRVALLDITNRNKDNEVVRRDQNLIILKPAKKSSKLDADISPSSVTQELRFLDTNKNRQVSNTSCAKSPRISSSSSLASDYHNHQSRGILNPHQEHHHHHNQQQQQQQQHKHKHSKKGGSGKSSSSPGVRKLGQPQGCSSHSIRNKKEEPFVRPANKVAEKMCKKTPLLSSDILNINGPTILQVKKDPSPPPTKLPHKQSQVVSSDAAASLSSKWSTQQLSSNPGHSYKQLHLLSEKSNGCATATPGGAAAEHRNYIQKILRRAAAASKWHTPSHPIDPSIFYHLELFHPTTTATILIHRCNRRLIFHLVDELLAEILKPHFDSKNWVPETPNLSLVDGLCKKIDDFPAKNCQVLEDIDSLIDKDMAKWTTGGMWLSQGELEIIVVEIEGEIMEELVVETAAAMVVRDRD